MAQAKSSEKVVQEIRRKTRRRFSAEEKIRIVLDGVRGEESIATLCRGHGASGLAATDRSGEREAELRGADRRHAVERDPGPDQGCPPAHVRQIGPEPAECVEAREIVGVRRERRRRGPVGRIETHHPQREPRGNQSRPSQPARGFHRQLPDQGPRRVEASLPRREHPPVPDRPAPRRRRLHGVAMQATLYIRPASFLEVR